MTQTKPRAKRKLPLPLVLIGIFLFFATLLITSFQGMKFNSSSVFDEGVHFDYVYKLVENPFQLPPLGASMSEESLREVSCRGVQSEAISCAKPMTIENANVSNATNYVLMYAPVFYYPAALITFVVHKTIGFSFWDSARLATSLLFSLGMVFLYFATWRLSRNIIVAAGVTTLVAGVPLMLFFGSTISPEAMAPFSAGAAVWILSSKRMDPKSLLLLGTLLGIVVGLIKPNFVPIGMVIVALSAVRYLADNTFDGLRRAPFSRTSRKFWLVSLLIFSPLVIQVLWNLIRRLSLLPGRLPDGGLNDALLRTDKGFFEVVIDAATALLSPAGSISIPASMTVLLFGVVVQSLVLAFYVFGIFGDKNSFGSDGILLSRLGALGVLFSVVYIPGALYFSYHSTGTQSRYAFPLLILGIVGLGMLSLKRASSRYALLACGIAAFGVGVITILSTY